MPKVIELRASNAHRWMICHGQPTAVAGFADTPGSAADRGTVAHALLETMLRLDIPSDEIDRFADKPMIKEQDGRRFDHILIDDEIMRGVSHALDYVRGYLAEHPEADYEVECALDATSFVGYETGGTGDVVITNLPDELVVLDYKNGVQHVDHEDNEQLHIYALGALAAYSDRVTPETKVRMVIVQPNSRKRGGPIREAAYTYHDLLVFAKKAAAAARAAHGKNPLRVAGEHCSFCRAAGSCRTYAEHAMSAAQLEFADLEQRDNMALADPRRLKTSEMADVLAGAMRIRQWLNAVEAEAIRRLVARRAIPGFKLVQSSPHRRWDDPEAVIKLLRQRRYEHYFEDLVPRVPLTPARIEQRLNRKRDGNSALLAKLATHMVRNPVEPRVAPLDDVRPEYHRGDEFEERG